LASGASTRGLPRRAAPPSSRPLRQRRRLRRQPPPPSSSPRREERNEAGATSVRIAAALLADIADVSRCCGQSSERVALTHAAGRMIHGAWEIIN